MKYQLQHNQRHRDRQSQAWKHRYKAYNADKLKLKMFL